MPLAPNASGRGLRCVGERTQRAVTCGVTSKGAEEPGTPAEHALADAPHRPRSLARAINVSVSERAVRLEGETVPDDMVAPTPKRARPAPHFLAIPGEPCYGTEDRPAPPFACPWSRRMIRCPAPRSAWL